MTVINPYKLILFRLDLFRDLKSSGWTRGLTAKFCGGIRKMKLEKRL